QSEHDDYYGYGHLRVDHLISSMGGQVADVSGDNSRAGDARMDADSSPPSSGSRAALMRVSLQSSTLGWIQVASISRP
ncbi:MAG TPA: hypothetical protein QF671_05560, partial [Candidatus Thalassarchaeaceae archaeon]|nr:hypothetical protein [Candidatus Thalassarchaeaceae archaeon]